MRATWGLAMVLVAAFGAALGGACLYSPNVDNGRLLCGTNNECPKGYTCMAGHLCYKDGTGPDGGAGGGTGTGGTGSGTGGIGGSGGSGGIGGSDGVLTRDDLVGTWNFTSGTLQINCSDNTKQTKQLAGSGDHVDISTTGDTMIIGSYYCHWVLNLSIVGGTATTVVRPAQMCSSSSGGTDFTWNATTFSFTTRDGQTGSLNATIQAVYTDAMGNGTCTLVAMGNLAKQ